MNPAYQKFDLRGRTAVVTGGGTGLGYFMSRGLVRSGARVVITARREEVLERAAERLNAEDVPGEAVYHPVDLASKDSISGLIGHVNGTFGGADIFIGNAAQDFLEPFDEVQDSSMESIWQVNFASNVQLLRAFLPRMREKKWGRAIFSSSTSTVCSPAAEGMSMYTATKGALNSFTKTVAAETGHDGITVNTLVLGFYLTELMIDAMALLNQEHGQIGRAHV